ncbi:MAG TPA: uroporphyrinogen-III synthase, partial [Candidatus Angelobacter sp.]|nr:uroporphyrinogen-III synthase [Candidatus Angelobacter sp.]
ALLHRRILVTRDDASAKRMAEHIKLYGGDPVITPVLAFQKVLVEKQQIIKAFESDWLVFTSGNGVRFFLASLDAYHLDKRRLTNIAVVGEKTQKVLQKEGLNAKLVPDTFSAKGLATAFKTLPVGQTITLVKGRLAREALEIDLTNLGHHVTSITVYDTVPNASIQPKLEAVLNGEGVDVLTLTSPSALHFFLKLSGLEAQDAFFNQIKVACIGPETRQAAIQLGLKNIIMPDRYTADALIDSIAEAFLNQS